MNKKGEQEEGFGETGNAIKVVTMLVAATIMTLSLVGVSNRAIADQLTADARVDEFLTFEAVRHCFLYENNGRIYYDTIDRNNFTDERLKECIPNVRVAASLTTPDNRVIEVAESGLSAIGESAAYTYYINVRGSNEVHRLAVKTLRLS